MKKRPQVTVGETIRFLQSCPENMLIFCSESEYSEEEPHELVYEEKTKPCTVIDITESCPGERYITFGYVLQGNSNETN